MKSVRIVSTVLFYVSRVLSIGYLATGIYAMLSFVLNLPSFEVTQNGRRFIIFYPFTHKPFLLGDNTPIYMAEMSLTLILYGGVFFWLLSNVFKTFMQKKLFTQFGITSLTRFYLANFFVPAIVLGVLSIFSYEDYPYEVFITFHAIIGVFAYFIAAIFKQGVLLQNDQDLYI